MLEVIWLDASNSLPVINDLGPGLDKRVEDNIAIKVDDRNTRQPITLLGQNPLAVDGQDLGLPGSCE